MILATLARKIAVTAAVMVTGLGAAVAIWRLDQRGLPSSAQLATWLREPLTTDTFLFVVASAVVMVVVVTVAAALRIAAMALGAAGSRRRAKVRFQPNTLARSVAAALVGTAAVAGIADAAVAAVATTGDGAAGDAPSGRAPCGPEGAPRGQSGSPAAADAAAPRRDDLDTRAAVGAVRTGHTPFAGPARAAHANQLPPAHASALTSIAANRDRVTVRRGDTLWDIAGTELGDPRRWPEVFDLNKGKRQANGYALHDPDEIHIGWILGLPAGHRAAPPAPPRESTNPTPPTRPADVAPPVPPTPDPAYSPAQGDDGVVVPSATVTASPAPGGSPAASPTTPIPSADRTSEATQQPAVSDGTSPTSALGWVQIAGGAMGVALAAALVYTAAMVWRRRRHQFRPVPITSPNVRDADLTGPVAALAWLRRSVRLTAPHLLDRRPERGPTVREYVTAQVKPALPPQGPTGGELAGVGALPVTVGLGLDGPAARDAARAVLVATLTAGDADDPQAQGRVITSAATLASLLGGSAVAVPPMQRLTVVATFPAALALLEEEIIRRNRIVAEHDADSVFALREQWTFGEPLPQLLLIADVPDPRWHPRLSTAIRLGKNVDIGAVLIGTWSEGATLTVAADGTTHDGNGERVAVLDTAATADILAMLAEAHGDTEPAVAAAPSPEAAHLEPATATPGPIDNTAPADPDTPESEPRTADASTQPATTVAAPGDTPATNVVRARVLGEPAILGRDGKPVRGLRAKSVELFVYLVVHRAGARLDDIMEALWPDVTVSRAGDRLSTCVGNLRTTIRSIAQPDTDQAGTSAKIEPVINTGGRYHLNPSVLQVDWWTVQDAYARVAAAADNDARLTDLQAAIAAAGGGLADGSGYEWVDTDREHVRRRLLTIYAQAADLQVDSDPGTALALYDTACALDPLCEDLARRAMRTAARLGDGAGVSERLNVLRRELDDNGMDIDPDTEELATTLLSEGAKP